MALSRILVVRRFTYPHQLVGANTHRIVESCITNYSSYVYAKINEWSAKIEVLQIG